MTNLVALLEKAVDNLEQRQQLLREQETLQNIVSDITCWRWLVKQVALAQTGNRNDLVRSGKVRNLIVLIMQNSGSIQRQNDIHPDVYDEALSRTWEWFAENLSNNLSNYDPDRGSLITWFNNYLGWRIKDISQELDFI